MNMNPFMVHMVLGLVLTIEKLEWFNMMCKYVWKKSFKKLIIVILEKNNNNNKNNTPQLNFHKV